MLQPNYPALGRFWRTNMPLYADNETSPEAEAEGIRIEFSDFYMVCARAGGANKAYTKLLDKKTKPLRGESESGKLSEEKAMAVLKDVFSHTIVKSWGGPGLVDRDGNPMDCTPENVLRVFTDLHDVFLHVRAEVNKATNYLKSELEADAKN